MKQLFIAWPNSRQQIDDVVLREALSAYNPEPVHVPKTKDYVLEKFAFVSFRQDDQADYVLYLLQSGQWKIAGQDVTACEAQFHNPYNFVPALPRKRDKARLEGFAGDSNPVDQHLRHDRFGEELWSGRIPVKVTVITPLLLLQSTPIRLEGEHPIYDMLDSFPYSRIRGMLLNAYEIITNSRYTALSKHDELLPYRMSTTDAAKLIPARVEKDPNSDNTLSLRLMQGDVKNFEQGSKTPLMYAAWLKRYKRYDSRSQSQHDKHEGDVAIKYDNEDIPKHGERVSFQFTVEPKIDKCKFLRVKPGSVQRYNGSGTLTQDTYDGYVCVTGANIMKKEYERIFYDRSEVPIYYKLSDLDEEVRRYAFLIKNYRDIHEKDREEREKEFKKQLDGGSVKYSSDPNIPRMKQYIGHEPGKFGFSSFVWEDGHEALREGALVYVDVKRDKNGHPICDESGKPTEVTGIFPVMISRELPRATPIDLLDPPSDPSYLRPAESADDLSPAERLFGWVAGRGGPGKHKGYRGRVTLDNGRVFPPDPKTGHIQCFEGTLPLTILGQPKAAQARFYVGAPNGASQSPGGGKRKAIYQPGKRLRGRKVYPHHGSLDQLAEYWQDPLTDRSEPPVNGRYFQEYRKPNGKEQKSSQNRSVTGWIKPQTTYCFDLRVHNLQSEELGALLWLLTEPEGCFRLGYGRPLGFGSVKLKLDLPDSQELPLGQAKHWRGYYSNLAGDEPCEFADRQGAIKAFQQAMVDAYGPAESVSTTVKVQFESLSFIKAFLKSLSGFQDGLPVHYPRVHPKPDPEGKNFQWFTDNEAGQKLSLPDLTSTNSLPYFAGKPSQRRP